MSYKEILQLLDTVPFVPFRLYLTDGKTYTVPHPDFAWLMPNRATLLVAPRSKKSGHLLERMDYVAILHIVRIEHIIKQAA